MISAARRSWSAFTKLKRNITAIDSQPRAFRRWTPARTASSSRGEQDLALEVDPLGDRDAGPPAGDRDRGRGRRVPDLLLVDPAHLDLVAVALGDEQAGGRTVHLDHRVVRGRGAVDEDVHLVAELAQATGRSARPAGRGRS